LSDKRYIRFGLIVILAFKSSKAISINLDREAVSAGFYVLLEIGIQFRTL
jgi:hypothetical protein